VSVEPAVDATTYWVNRAKSADDQPTALAAGLLACGITFVDHLRDAAEADDADELLLAEAWRIAVEWLRGQTLSTRSDEAELRAQMAHDLLSPQAVGERSDVLAAKALLAMPAGHPLRDEMFLLAVLRRGIARSRRAGDGDGELEALAGLLHPVLPGRRVGLRWDRRGLQLVAEASDGIAAMFWLSRASYYSRTGLLATTPAVRRRWAREALNSVDRVEALDVGSALAVTLARALAAQAAGDLAGAAQLYQCVLADSEGVGNVDVLMSAGMLWADVGHPDLAAAALRRAVPPLAREYVLAVTASQVEYAGGQLTRAVTALAFAECAEGRWGVGLMDLDRAKSLRLRHQLELRRGVDADELLRLDQLAMAMERGSGWKYRLPDDTVVAEPPYRTEYWLSPEVRLRLAVREERAAAAKIPEPPDPFDVAARLPADAAVLVIGLCAGGMIVAVLTRNDRQRPTAGWIDREWPLSRWISVISEESVTDLPDRLGEVLGARVAATLAGRQVRRLWVVPHLWSHSVPFQAVPRLADFDVVQLPALAALADALDDVSVVDGVAVVIGDPTGDLRLAGLEALVVADHLATRGTLVHVYRGAEATRAALPAADCGLLHFAGHGRSDQINPRRSALLLHHAGAISALAAGLDPLAEMASDVRDWTDVADNAREAVLRPVGTLREIRHGDAVERVFEHTRQLTVMIRRQGDTASAADLWSAGEIAASGDLTGCRLAVLTACHAAAATSGPNLIDESSGLPAALTLLGVRTVVAPLWPVAEDTALLFADRCYDLLTQRSDADGRVDVASAVRDAARWLAKLTSRDAIAELARLRDRATEPTVRARLNQAAARRARLARPYGDLVDRAAFVVIGSGSIAWPSTHTAHAAPR
jgi:hypothetical protein